MPCLLRNTVCIALIVLMAHAQCGAWARDLAADYPRKPLRMVVPFAPGGSSDVVGRLIGQKLVDIWGQQLVIDNRPGAGGAIGAEQVARATPDGYTVLFSNPGPRLYNVLLRKKPSYTLSNLAPVIYIGYAVNAIVASPRFPPNNIRELIAYAKANPGKINWAPRNSITIRISHLRC